MIIETKKLSDLKPNFTKKIGISKTVIGKKLKPK